MSDTDKNLCLMLALRGELQLDTPHATLQGLRNSAQFNTFELLCNELGRNSGYLAWADIGKESWRALCERGQLPRYSFEWSEGRLLLLHDVVLAPGMRPALREGLRRLFARRRAVVFIRRGALRIYARRQGRLRLVARRRLEAPAHPPSMQA